MTDALILRNLFDLAQNPDAVAWQAFREGVEIHWLYQTGETGPAAALIRFQPGAQVPMHEHMGFEHIIVLAGSQTDENGIIERGALLIHPPGTHHRIVSEKGCIVLAIYERQVVFDGE